MSRLAKRGGAEGAINATLLIALFLLLLVGLPALAVWASARIRRLEIARSPEPPLPAAPTRQRFAELESRISLLEARISSLETGVPLPARPPVSAAPTAGHPPGTEVAAAAAFAPAPAESHFEKVVTERWLIYIGIFAVLFATAFFIQYSFQESWLGMWGRVGVGLLFGAALVAWSGPLLHRGYGYFSEVIAGLGAAVLYYTVRGGWHAYALVGVATALAGMAVATGLLVALAIRRKSPRLFVLAIVGAFLTPLLLPSAALREALLFAYLLAVAAALLAVSWARKWLWVAPFLLLCLQTYFWTWFALSYQSALLEATLFYATAAFLLFSVPSHFVARRAGHLPGSLSTVVVLNLVAYLVALRELFWPGERWLLAVAILLVGAAHLSERQSLVRRFGAEARSAERLLSAMVLVCLSAAVPARIGGVWLTMAWSLEAAGVVWLGARLTSWRLRLGGLILLSIVAIRLLVLRAPAAHFLWNARFAAFVVGAACFAFAAVWLARQTIERAPYERTLSVMLLVAVSSYALIGLSLDVWDLFARLRIAGIEHGPAQQMALSVLWTVFAGGLALAGMVKKSALMRWQALGLFALVVGKVFLYDLSSLERFYRILSFLVLGILLLAVSFLYKRHSSHRSRSGHAN